MSDLKEAVEMILNEFHRRYAVVPTIRLSIFSDTMTEEDATKIVEETAKELGLSNPERDSRNGSHWVSASRWAPNDIDVAVFYNKEEEE